MKLFNSKSTIVYLEDRVGYISIDKKGDEESSLIPFDIPAHVLVDGRIQDNSQLHYLLKQNLDTLEVSKNPCVFVVNTSEAVNRAMHVPAMSDKEIRSLIENESDNLFVQNLEEYRLIYRDLESGEDIHHLLISICAEDLIEDYVSLSKGLGLKMTGLIPLSTYLIQYAHHLGGGRIGLMAMGHDGFYYANENRYYGRTELSDGFTGLMDRYGIEFSDLLRAYLGQYDERIVDIDRDAFRRELESYFYDALTHIENIGNDFALENRKLLTGSISESGLYDDITTNSDYTLLPLEDIFSLAHEQPEEIQIFSGNAKRQGFNKNFILPLVAVLAAFGILIGSFIYGEKIKQENRELIVQSEQQQEQGEMDGNQSSGENYQVDLADLITKVKSSAPDTVSISNLEYQGDTLAISGESTDSSAIENWKNELESVLGKTVNEEPTATIGDTIYFKFTVPLEDDSSGTSEDHQNMENSTNSNFGGNAEIDSDESESL